MAIFHLGIEELYDLDRHFREGNPESLDREIEDIVESLWSDTGEWEQMMRPFFTSFLQANLLRPLYFYYFSLTTLQKKYASIIIDASNDLLDIVATHLEVTLCPNRTMHNEEFYLVRKYLFSRTGLTDSWFRAAAREVFWICRKVYGRVRGIEVIYLNAGKLDSEFRKIKRGVSATMIPNRTSHRLVFDHNLVRDKVLSNVRNATKLLPSTCTVQLVELRVLSYLPDLVHRIGAIADIIDECRVKLLIATASTHEDHLCLLAAARITQARSLVTSHGVSFAYNRFLDNYITDQALLIDFEARYEGARHFHVRYDWFDEKI